MTTKEKIDWMRDHGDDALSANEMRLLDALNEATENGFPITPYEEGRVDRLYRDRFTLFGRGRPA